ncbi:MAG: hypothetical protein A2255_09985 [Candidatus Melainabacteria bacterium RIFOXYA2_FULL_32_9]|nr:MAG: hypothetical protein A2255_09985 [Candidatus Melainabacteria bacterium RIFOXYA2_FULL_32_9]
MVESVVNTKKDFYLYDKKPQNNFKAGQNINFIFDTNKTAANNIDFNFEKTATPEIKQKKSLLSTLTMINPFTDKSKKYEKIIQKYAEKYNVDKNLIKAVIKKESGFNSKAKSPVGASGLMQLMPGTAKDLGVKNSQDPEQNIAGGVKYLAGLLKKYKGNKRSALAAYNAGSGTVDDYLKGTNRTHRNPKKIKTPDGIPPYKETQDYVKKVLKYYKQYSKADNKYTACI